MPLPCPAVAALTVLSMMVLAKSLSIPEGVWPTLQRRTRLPPEASWMPTRPPRETQSMMEALFPWARKPATPGPKAEHWTAEEPSPRMKQQLEGEVEEQSTMWAPLSATTPTWPPWKVQDRTTEPAAVRTPDSPVARRRRDSKRPPVH